VRLSLRENDSNEWSETCYREGLTAVKDVVSIAVSLGTALSAQTIS